MNKDSTHIAFCHFSSMATLTKPSVLVTKALLDGQQITYVPGLFEPIPKPSFDTKEV